MAHILVLACLAALFPLMLAAVVVILTRPRPKRLLLSFLIGGWAMSVTTGLLVLHAFEGSDAKVLGSGDTVHPDAAIFTSLPKAGTVRAARLLAETGDAPRPPPDSRSTRPPGRRHPFDQTVRQGQGRHVQMGRYKQLRGAVIDFAGDSHHANAWAADLYAKARARGHDHPHATRILARAWLHIIWRCWQDRVPYDPAKHNALQRLQRQAA